MLIYFQLVGPLQTECSGTWVKLQTCLSTIWISICRFCTKCETGLWIPNDDVVACLKSQKIDWIPLCLAIWNIITDRLYLRRNRTRCLITTNFSCYHSSTNKSANLPKRQAIAGRRTVRLLLVLNDAHRPINNPTVKIAIRANKRPYCQETPQQIRLPSHTTMEIYVFITMTHHFSYIFLMELW